MKTVDFLLSSLWFKLKVILKKETQNPKVIKWVNLMMEQENTYNGLGVMEDMGTEKLVKCPNSSFPRFYLQY